MIWALGWCVSDRHWQPPVQVKLVNRGQQALISRDSYKDTLIFYTF